MAEAAVETEVSEETGEETKPETKAPEPSSDVARLEGEMAALRRQNEQLAQRLESLGEKKPAEAPEKVYTRTELAAAVEAGTLTEEQRDDILAEQRERALERRMERKFQERMASERRQATADAERAAFHRTHPEAWQNGTPERAKLQSAFDKLVALGHDANDPITEITALNMAFPEGTEKIRERTRREAHEETGSGGETPTPKGKEWAHDIPKKLRGHYDRMIEQGLYTGRDDPKLLEEIKIARRKSAA